MNKSSSVKNIFNISFVGFMSILIILAFGICSFAQGDLIALKDTSVMSINRTDLANKYIFGFNLNQRTVGEVKSEFVDADSIRIFRGTDELNETQIIATGDIIKSLSSDEEITAVIYGDVNRDAAIDAFDLMGIDLAINSLKSYSAAQYLAASDIDEDGTIGLNDYNAVKNYISGTDFEYDIVACQTVNYHIFYNSFTTVFEHTDAFLYRIGNGNAVKLGNLFKIDVNGDNAVVSNNVNVKVEALDSQTSVNGNGTNLVSGSTAKCTYTKNSSDWTQSTLKFSGEGPVRVTVSEGNGEEYSLLLEVVTANNSASSAAATSSNIVLLGDITATGRFSVSRTLYGNGFSVIDARSDTSGAAGFITLSGNAVLDNVKISGQVYSTAVTSGTENQGYSSCLWVTGGNIAIYNSYISECKYALQVDSGTVTAENSVFDGGAVGNINLNSGELTLKDCTTTSSTRGGLKGLGVHITSATAKLIIKGDFRQYNWLKKSDLPSSYSTIMSSVYNNSTYAYTYNGTAYVNMGVLFFTEAGSIPVTTAQDQVTDTTSNSYGFIEKSVGNYTGAVYTEKSATMAADRLTTPSPVFYENQYFTIPAYSFDYTTKNYKAKTEGSNEYCYYDSTTKKVLISFDKESDSSSFAWDTDILSVTKYGLSIPSTVTVNGVDFTGRSYTFTESGDYEIVYTYTDTKNYDKDGNASSVTYSKTVKINVTAVEPDDSTYYASFAYDGAAGNYNAKKVIGTDNKTYVMPDVTATSSTVGSTTVAGKTVYYPIVTVNPTSSNGNSAYSGGKGYYFAPVFSEIHIIDYNQDTGAKLYEYSKSTTTWPHSKSATAGPDTNYFTCASGEKTWSGTSPYARSMNAQYYGYGKNNLGVCYTSTEIEKDNTASTHLVQYHYVSTDGTTYYYYVQYNFGAMTYSGCVTDGTLVTMADGTKKPIEEIKVGDTVMTWSMWNGRYEAQPVVMHWYHGTKAVDVLTLSFSDGTDVRTVNQHGFFDIDKNSYVYITPDNASDYIGHSFVKQADDGTSTAATLTGYMLAEETVGIYSIQTAYNENFIVEGMLSITGEDYKGRFEYFEIGECMKYDEAQMQADIEQYGLYAYEDFSEWLSPIEFEMFNGKYFKVLVGKGVLTYEDILEIIRDNLSR